MSKYNYQARDTKGLIQQGNLEALGEDEVVGILQNRGLIVVSLSREDVQAKGGFATRKGRAGRRMHGRATVDDQVIFCQQLATLVDAGVPLLRSLEVVSAQIESRALLIAVDMMRQDIEAGLAFHEALAKHPNIFSNFWINMVETGEASGHMAQSLQQLAKYFESIRELQREAVTAMTYPAVLVLGATVAIAIFMLKIIPIFSGVFESMDIELPLLTQIVVTMSNVTRQYFVVLILGLVAVGYALRWYLRTESGLWMRDRLLLRIPLTRIFVSQLQLAQFSRGLATLLDSGVPIIFGLEILEHSATNKVFGQAITEVKDAVREGKPMVEPMDSAGVFPPMMIQMVQVGEEVGELGKMMGRVANYYEDKVQTLMKRMTILFEPIAIVFMAVVIGVLVISIFMPIFSMAGGF